MTTEGITLLTLKMEEGATTQGMKVPLEGEGKEMNSPLMPLLCPMSESPSGKREGFQDNATRKKGSLLLTRVRAPAASNAVVRGQRAPSPSCYPNF